MPGIGSVRLLVRWAAVWVLIILAETVNGTIREIFLTPAFGVGRARAVSFVSALVFISLITYLSFNYLGADTAFQRVSVGLFWAVLTFAFEAGLTAFVFGFASDRFANDYDPRRGGLMLFGLAFMALVPTAAFVLRRARSQALSAATRQ